MPADRSVAISLTCPAKYHRYVLAAVVMAIGEVGRDVELRADEEPNVQRLAPVPDEMISDEAGTIEITIQPE